MVQYRSQNEKLQLIGLQEEEIKHQKKKYQVDSLKVGSTKADEPEACVTKVLDCVCPSLWASSCWCQW